MRSPDCGTPGCNEDRAEFCGFAPQCDDLVNRRMTLGFQHIQPEFGFVSFFDHDIQSRNEVLPGSRAPGGAVVGSYAGAGPQELGPNQFGQVISPECQTQVNDVKGKLTGSRSKGVSDHAGET